MLLILVVSTGYEGSAQVEFKLLEFKIADSFEAENKKGEPARFIAMPDRDTVPLSFLADMAVALEFIRYKSLKVSAFGEWHRNTLIPLEQHVQQVGLTAIATLWNELGNCRTCFAGDVNVSGRYSRNLIAASGPFEVGIYSTYLTPYWLKAWRRADFLRPTAISPAGNRPFARVLQFSYVVFGGVEYLSYDDVLMPNLTARAEFYPLSATLQRMTRQHGNLVARVSYTHRENISGNVTDFDIGNHLVFGVRVQHKFEWNKSEATIGAGYDYSKGPNPILALKSQEYGTISIKFKLSLRAQRTFW